MPKGIGPVAEQPTKPKAEDPAAAPPAAGSSPSWRSSWQMPALIGSVLLLAGGAVTAVLTAPKPDLSRMLSQAESLVEAEKYDEALEGLNGKLLPYLSRGMLSHEQQGRFHLLRGRAVYLGQGRLGIDLGENAQVVLDELGAAKTEGVTLTSRDVYFMADAMVSLGQYTRALDLAGELPEAEGPGRSRILKRIVERQLRDPQQSGEMALKLLADFLVDPGSPAADRAWALARQTELLVRRGLAESAITKLVQTMPMLVDQAGPEAMGELHLLLGRAYLETGALPEAGKQLLKATELLLPSDERWAMATVQLARVEEQTRAPEEARAEVRQKYKTVIERFSGSPARLAALLALGELEGTSPEAEGTDASIAAYTELVRELKGALPGAEPTAQQVTTSLLARSESRASQGVHQSALRFAALAEQLYGKDAVPAEVLMALAASSRALAEGMLRGGEGGAALTELARLDPATREQARVHLLNAGGYFKRHADRVGVADNEAFGRSLWLAADSYDLAGEPAQAIALFGDYAKYFPADPRRPEAIFRLGQAYQARGEYGLAADQYGTLLTSAAEAGANVGPYADMSAVPLAQCLLLDTDAGNDAEAEAMLWKVVQGGLGAAGTRQYRDALVELAALQSKRGDHAGAIQNLEEAVARHPDDPQIASMLYALADAYRQDARAIRRSLGEALPDSRRQALTETRAQRLKKAQELFDRSEAILSGRDERTLSPLDRLQRRNAGFFSADCAFDLRDFEQAIRRYDAAREKYPQDPASLVAMVQIVNAYVEMGDVARAATANERAKLFHKSLPAAAWADPDLPMGQEEWQRWLDSMDALKNGEVTPRPSATAPERERE